MPESYADVVCAGLCTSFTLIFTPRQHQTSRFPARFQDWPGLTVFTQMDGVSQKVTAGTFGFARHWQGGEHFLQFILIFSYSGASSGFDDIGCDAVVC